MRVQQRRLLGNLAGTGESGPRRRRPSRRCPIAPKASVLKLAQSCTKLGIASDPLQTSLASSLWPLPTPETQGLEIGHKRSTAVKGAYVKDPRIPSRDQEGGSKVAGCMSAPSLEVRAFEVLRDTEGHEMSARPRPWTIRPTPTRAASASPHTQRPPASHPTHGNGPRDFGTIKFKQSSSALGP